MNAMPLPSDLLVGLSRDEKQMLYDRIALDLAGAPAAFSRVELDTWDALAQVCADASRKNMQQRVTAYGRKRFSERCHEIEDFISESCEPLMRFNVRSNVRTALLRCLSEWLRKNGVTVSVTTLLNSVGYLPGAVDESFPGYADAKLLHRVARAYAA